MYIENSLREARIAILKKYHGEANYLADKNNPAERRNVLTMVYMEVSTSILSDAQFLLGTLKESGNENERLQAAMIRIDISKELQWDIKGLNFASSKERQELATNKWLEAMNEICDSETLAIELGLQKKEDKTSETN